MNKKTKITISLLLFILSFGFTSFHANACSGGVYACGDVTIEAITSDALQNCPSGSSIAVIHCDGGTFWVHVK